MLADKIEEYEKTKKAYRTTPAGYKDEFPWLKEVDSLALANEQLHLEAAYRHFFIRPESGYPKYKSRHRSKRTYTTNVVNGNIELQGKHLKLPKLKKVKIKAHRQIPEGYRLKSVTITQEPSGKYYASLLYEYPEEENQIVREAENVLGIDYAMKGMGVFSNGRRAEYPGYYRKAEEKLAREQSKLSKCRKGSANYRKQKRRVALCHEKVRNQRKDHQHKLSRRLAEEYDAVAVEDLNMKAMSQAMHFGKSVMDNGYGMFLTMLEYKLKDRGKQLVRVDRRFPSSKRCSRCGRVKKTLGLDERTYVCECGNVMDRDLNAAINIREEGKRMMRESA